MVCENVSILMGETQTVNEYTFTYNHIVGTATAGYRVFCSDSGGTYYLSPNTKKTVVGNKTIEWMGLLEPPTSPTNFIVCDVETNYMMYALLAIAVVLIAIFLSKSK